VVENTILRRYNNMITRIARLFAVAAFAAIGAHAQVAPLADQTRYLLQSQNLRDKAWGAWYGGTSHDSTLRELLVEQLRLAQPLRNSGPDTDAYAYIQALFDALIQIPGPIPSDVILSFESSWRTEILILLNRDPAASGNEASLLDMREHSMPDPEWITVNDLLFSISSKPFFQRTLHEIQVTHDFWVKDQEGIGCGGAMGCGDSTIRFPKGFPPVARYQLKTTMSPGDILLVDRPVAVYYRRIVVPTDHDAGWGYCQSAGFAETRQTLRARFFSAIDGLSADQSEKLFGSRTSIEWRSAAQVTEEIENRLGMQAAGIQALVGHAQERGLVDASGAHLPVEITVEDLRGDRSVPLPRFQPREIVIQ
jgi:hypothetical protein